MLFHRVYKKIIIRPVGRVDKRGVIWIAPSVFHSKRLIIFKCKLCMIYIVFCYMLSFLFFSICVLYIYIHISVFLIFSSFWFVICKLRVFYFFLFINICIHVHITSIYLTQVYIYTFRDKITLRYTIYYIYFLMLK